MTFHLCGFTESQDSAVLTNIAALADQSVQVNGDDIIVPNDLTLLGGVYALGPSLTRANLTSPSIRRMFSNEIARLDLSATPTDQLLVSWHGDSRLQLDPGEQMNAQMAEGAAGASRGTVLAWLFDRIPQPISADIRTIRVTSSGTAVANAWTNINLTFNDILPAGVYSLVGMMLQSTNMQAFRAVFKGGYYRPGAVGITAFSQRHHPIFRLGGLGEWGQFDHLTPPSVDVLCNGADAAFAGVMDLVYLGR